MYRLHHMGFLAKLTKYKTGKYEFISGDANPERGTLTI